MVARRTAVTKPNVSLRQEIEGEVGNFDGVSLPAEASILEAPDVGHAAAPWDRYGAR